MNIVAQTDRFTSGLAYASKKLSDFANKAATLRNALTLGLGFEGLRRMITGFEEAGSSLHDLSVATGVTVENLAMLQYAAEQSGASMENLQLAFKTMAKQGIDPNRFGELAQRLARIENPTVRARKALQLFGKQGMTLLPMISELPQLSAEFQKLGGGMTTRMANQADNLGDSWGRAKLAMENVRNHIVDALAPSLIALSEWVGDHVRSLTEWIDKNRTLVTWTVGLAAGMAALITPILGVAKVITVLIDLYKKLNIQMAIAWALKNPLAAAGIAAGLLAAYAGYKMYQAYNDSAPFKPGQQHGASGGWGDDETATNTGNQVEQQRRTNQLLEMLMKQNPQLAPAGVN